MWQAAQLEYGYGDRIFVPHPNLREEGPARRVLVQHRRDRGLGTRQVQPGRPRAGSESHNYNIEAVNIKTE